MPHLAALIGFCYNHIECCRCIAPIPSFDGTSLSAVFAGLVQWQYETFLRQKSARGGHLGGPATMLAQRALGGQGSNKVIKCFILTFCYVPIQNLTGNIFILVRQRI